MRWLADAEEGAWVSKRAGVKREVCVGNPSHFMEGSWWGEMGCQGALIGGGKLSHSLPSFSPMPGKES